MKNYTTLSQDIYTTKRSIVNFSSKLSKGMQKPNRDFLMDMLFGLAKGNPFFYPKLLKRSKSLLIPFKL